MAVISRSHPYKPYRLLGREIRVRLQHRDKSRQGLADHLGLHVNHLHAILAGLRPFPVDKLDEAVSYLGSPSEDLVELKNRMMRLAEPGMSRVHLLHGSSETKVILGYVDWPPFVKSRGIGDTNPSGLLIELVNLLFTLVGAKVSWQRLEFSQMLGALSDGDVDAVMSFVLDSLKRRTESRFLPLGMPFFVGINAVTISPEFDEEQPYSKALERLQKASKRPKKNGPIAVVVVGDEIADDYLAAVAPDTNLPIRDRRSIVEAIRHYTSTEPYVVFADSVSCETAQRELQDRPLRQLFDRPVGSFEGGFLLPTGDPEWEEYFTDAFQHLMSAKLPETGRIFLRYADDLQSFLGEDQTVFEWIDKCWPKDQMDEPDSWPKRQA